MSEASRTAARPPGREHIPIYPNGFIAVRIVQLVLAVVIIGLAGFGISYLPFDGNSLILAVAVMTIVSSIYHLVVEYSLPAGYNYWAILGLDIFFVVMWLIAFAILTAQVAPLFGAGSYLYKRRTGRYTRVESPGIELTWPATQITAAALGGVQFVTFLVALIIHSIRLHRHRKAGLHCMPVGSNNPPHGAPIPVPVYTTDKTGQPVAMYLQQPYPLQQPQPAAMYPPNGQFYQVPVQQQQGAYFVPVPMPMPGQMMPGQQMPMPGQQIPPQQGGFYAPPPSQPTQSPPLQQIPPQQTGGSYATSELASQVPAEAGNVNTSSNTTTTAVGGQ